MLRYLSTGSSVIAALIAADEASSGAVRPDLLEFLLVRTLAAHEPRGPVKPEQARTPDQPPA